MITALLSILMASYLSFERLVLVNFLLAQSVHLFNAIGITSIAYTNDNCYYLHLVILM